MRRRLSTDCLVLILLVASVACASEGPTQESREVSAATPTPTGTPAVTVADLERAAAPLVQAHDALRDFQYKIDAGLTFGEVIRQWPDVSATVRRIVLDFRFDDSSILSFTDRSYIELYRTAIVEAHDAWLEMADNIGKHLRSTTRDSFWEIQAVAAYGEAQTAMKKAAEMRGKALTLK
jgi:hypothetical protein